MQNLRDKLLKAGVVDKKKARRARTEARRADRNKGADATVARERQQRLEQQMAEQAAAARERQQQLNAERERKEHDDRIRNIIERHALRRITSDERAFHFVALDRKKIRRLQTTYAIGHQLEQGLLAIVAASYDPARDYRLIDADTARRIEELAPHLLLFWNKPDTAGEQPA